MKKFQKVKRDIIVQLNKADYKGDLSDIGNEIGIVIGKYIKKKKLGYEKRSFIDGVNHGISLIDETH